MKRLITVEEHYNSKAVNEKIRKIYLFFGCTVKGAVLRKVTFA